MTPTRTEQLALLAVGSMARRLTEAVERGSREDVADVLRVLAEEAQQAAKELERVR